MYLNLLDTDLTNPLEGRVGNLDYDYQAEQWVQVLTTHPNACDPKCWVVKWELHDGVGLRARWERPDQDPGLPKLVFAAPRWTGEWKVGT
jgi:hypothetical protein